VIGRSSDYRRAVGRTHLPSGVDAERTGRVRLPPALVSGPEESSRLSPRWPCDFNARMAGRLDAGTATRVAPSRGRERPGLGARVSTVSADRRGRFVVGFTLTALMLLPVVVAVAAMAGRP
jgi:hypothetical protein